MSPCIKLGSIIWSRPNTLSNARCLSLRSPQGSTLVRITTPKSRRSPPGAAHAFGNSGSKPGRMLLMTAPPGHEKYFDELRDLISKGGKPDPDALAKLRAKYDTVQLATLTPG